jgi:hypothetical protein
MARIGRFDIYIQRKLASIHDKVLGYTHPSCLLERCQPRIYILSIVWIRIYIHRINTDVMNSNESTSEPASLSKLREEWHLRVLLILILRKRPNDIQEATQEQAEAAS